MIIDGGNDLTVGMTGLAGFIALSVVLVLLYFYDTFISRERILTGRLGAGL